MAGENWSVHRKNLSKCHFVYHKSCRDDTDRWDWTWTSAVTAWAVSQPYIKVNLYVVPHIYGTISASTCWKSEVKLTGTNHTILTLYVLIEKRCLWREMWIVYWKQNGFTKGIQFVGISNKIKEGQPFHCHIKFHSVCSLVVIHTCVCVSNSGASLRSLPLH